MRLLLFLSALLTSLTGAWNGARAVEVGRIEQSSTAGTAAICADSVVAAAVVVETGSWPSHRHVACWHRADSPVVEVRNRVEVALE